MGSVHSKGYVLHKTVVAGLLGMFCCKCPQRRFLKLTGRPKAGRCFLRQYKPSVISRASRRDYLVGISIRPNTPRCKLPSTAAPNKLFPKGNKKPRVGSGVQILKDKRLGWDRQRSTLSAPNWVPIPSTLKSLTAVFGMGTGVASSELLSVSFQPLK